MIKKAEELRHAKKVNDVRKYSNPDLPETYDVSMIVQISQEMLGQLPKYSTLFELVE